MNLAGIVGGMENAKMCVFGDIMLDVFTYGTVTRISPEAPVPVVEVSYTENKLGGCGNVASNLAALGAETYVFAVVGGDGSASNISGLLEEQRIQGMLVKDASRPTTTKERIIAHNQQVARLDREKKHGIDHGVEDVVLSEAGKLVDKTDVFILSDYAKGFLTDGLCKSLIEMANSAGKPVIVDPKATFSKYRKARTVTPNFDEFRKYTKPDVEKNPRDMLPYANSTIRDIGISSLLVTMGEDGMALFENNGYSRVMAVQNGYEVVDITGAGDTAIAAYSLAIAVGARPAEAMRIANYAAACVVTKLGTAVCMPEELKTMMKKDDSFTEVYI